MHALIPRVAALGALAALIAGVTSCRVNTPSQGPRPGPRFAVAYVPTGSSNLRVRLTVDGAAWTTERAVRDQAGNEVSSASSPALTADGRLYHLAWFDRARALRYATSADAERWLVSSDSLGTFFAGSLAQPAIAQGAGKLLIGFRSVGDRIEVTDSTATSPTRPHTFPDPVSAGPGLAFGNGRFLLAYVAAGGAIKVFESTDGQTWTALPGIPAGVPRDGPPVLAFANSAFHMLTREYRGNTSASFARMLTFTSPDGRAWTQNRDVGGRPNSFGWTLAGAGDDELVLESSGVVSAFKGSNAESRTAWSADRGPSAAQGPGRHLASLRLETITIQQEEDAAGDDPYFLFYGFKSRLGRPGSTELSWPGYLEQLGPDIDEGRSWPIDPRMGAGAWTIEQATDLVDDQRAQVDIVGAVIVAMESDACRWSDVRDTANEVQGVLRQEIDALIARGNLASLRDPAAFRARLAAARQRVEEATDTGIVGDILSWFGCATDKDELIDVKVVSLVGTELLDQDDVANNIFELDPARPSLPLRLTFDNRDQGATWIVDGHVTYR